MNLMARPLMFLRSLFSARARRVTREIRQLKRMIHMVEATSETEIACQEAYRLLDQYADMVIRGEDPYLVMPQVKHHLAMCADCREEFEVLLRALRISDA